GTRAHRLSCRRCRLPIRTGGRSSRPAEALIDAFKEDPESVGDAFNGFRFLVSRYVEACPPLAKTLPSFGDGQQVHLGDVVATVGIDVQDFIRASMLVIR